MNTTNKKDISLRKLISIQADSTCRGVPVTDQKAKAFGKILSEILQKKKMSFHELARLMKTSHQNVSRWANGLILPRMKLLENMACVLSVSLSELVPEIRPELCLEPPVKLPVYSLQELTGTECRNETSSACEPEAEYLPDTYLLKVDSEALKRFQIAAGDLLELRRAHHRTKGVFLLKSEDGLSLGDRSDRKECLNLGKIIRLIRYY